MRLVLLPISTKRTLLYCIRRDQVTAAATGRLGLLVDRATVKIANIWSGWEQRDGGWQRKVVDYGNHALRRIPYQEWGLKSVPPLKSRRRTQELAGGNKMELVFPPSIIAPHRAEGVLRQLGTEREALHRMRLMWCIIGMPITIPVAILPVVPNLPFFYLAYRAWSHWRAIRGGRHVQYLVDNKLLSPVPSQALDDIYAPTRLPSPLHRSHTGTDPQADTAKSTDTSETPEPERILVTPEIGKGLGVALDHPEIEIELERAVWQVEQSIKKAQAERSSAAKNEDAKKEE